MFFWIKDVLNEINEVNVFDFLYYINEMIKLIILNVVDMELYNLVKKLQIYSYILYCIKVFKIKCRFGFFKEKCFKIRIFGNINFLE